ncbi:MAG: B12-binding domain-containing radical SAM protein [Candidatus Brocadiaceae bacterium]|nr:B12-binding domain-containing radical SAM protein [Candidatus Brocadiaceae bacterium]
MMKILFVVYDNEGAFNTLPLGACYVAAYLRKHGYKDITFYSQDVYHYPEHHLTAYLNENRFDIVAMGFVAGYHQHRKILRICEAINKSDNRPFLVLAGHGPTPVPEFYIQKTGADAVILGEGEISFLNLVKALENNSSLGTVRGIAYKNGEQCIMNQREMTVKHIDELPEPYLDGLPMEYYINGKFPYHGMKKTDRMMVALSSRGCSYHCNFCQRLEAGYRMRSPEAIVEEIKKYKRDYNISFVIFLCELFMVSEKRAVQLAEAIIRADLNIRYWCTGRVNVATEKGLSLLKRSGCVCIDYGIEQFDNQSLLAMNKNQNEDHIMNAIELTQKAGISVAFNIIWGNKGDTKESLKKSVNLLNRYNDFLQLRVIRPVTPYPGTPLYDECVQSGLLRGPEDFYEKHKNVELLTVNMTEISEDDFYKTLFETNQEIIRNFYNDKLNQDVDSFRQVYFGGEYGYRGARHQ